MGLVKTHLTGHRLSRHRSIGRVFETATFRSSSVTKPSSIVKDPGGTGCRGYGRKAGGFGGDLLSHVLRRSTIGAEGFHGRVRDGIGCGPLAVTTRSTNRPEGPSADAVCVF